MSSESTSPIIPTIVLASYRGCPHIIEQLDSIQAQTHSEWRLLIRDDGSDDGTTDVLEARAQQDSRVELIVDEEGRLGVVRNFSRILEAAMQGDSDWFALCDQDDRWYPDKLERQLEWASRLGDGDPREPLLLHSDLAVAGPNLEPSHPSLHELMGIRHEARSPLATLLVQNFVTGCTTMVNRALLEIALPVPDDCVMYDWWLALCAAATGRIEFDSAQRLIYRQHDANAVGARPLRRALWKSVLRTLSPGRHRPQEFIDTLRQAAVLERHLNALESRAGASARISEASVFVTDYLDLFRKEPGRMRRVATLHRRRIRRQNPILDAMLKVRLLTSAIDWPGAGPDPDEEPLRGKE